MSIAIEFNHVSKQYRLGLVSTKTLSHDLDRWWKMNILGKEDPYLKIGETNDRSIKGECDYVWALKDIDFKVEQGDVVGIIGKNGAGKSTLLKLLSKVTGPTTGTIKARGRIGALLEVGTGFHQEMTGRENIYLNGAILGMSRQEISKKLDEIVDFSGCERYIDTPVKRYSSGMMVRLGFAVAAHLDPEILVVDEVLAVGDAEFQKKAIGKMQDVSKGEGRTVLFVSHNMGSVRALCHTGILLENGLVKYSGDIESTINEYQKNTLISYNFNKESVSLDPVSINDILVLDNDNNVVTNLFAGNDYRFVVSVNNNTGSEITNIEEFTMSIESILGEGYIVLNNVQLGRSISLKKGINIIEFRLSKFPLSSGCYRVGLWVSNFAGRLGANEAVTTINVDGTSFYESGKVHHNTRFLTDYEMNVL